MKNQSFRAADSGDRQLYLDGKADGQQNLIIRVAANWTELQRLKPLEVSAELQRLKDEICDE